MGTTTSFFYNHSRRFLLKYNAEHRAQNFIIKDKLPTAPRHPVSKDVQKKVEARKQSCPDLASIHEKSPQLEEYLKKVYLTSTPEVKSTVKSNRPLPIKTRRELKEMFYEPEQAQPGFCTLSNVVEILSKHQNDPEKWDVKRISEEYHLERHATAILLTYYSLFKLEDFQYMNAEAAEPKEEKIEFEVYSALEKKPIRQIEGKK